MTLDKFFQIITKDKNIEPYIVALKYKFDFEDKYTISNEYLDIDMDMSNHPYYPFEWLNDWNEGQTDIEVLGFKKLSEIQIIDPDLQERSGEE